MLHYRIPFCRTVYKICIHLCVGHQFSMYVVGYSHLVCLQFKKKKGQLVFFMQMPEEHWRTET